MSKQIYKCPVCNYTEKIKDFILDPICPECMRRILIEKLNVPVLVEKLYED